MYMCIHVYIYIYIYTHIHDSLHRAFGSTSTRCEAPLCSRMRASAYHAARTRTYMLRSSHMYVCMYVCMHACMYVCMCVYVYIYIYIIHIHNECISLSIYIYIYIYIYTHTRIMSYASACCAAPRPVATSARRFGALRPRSACTHTHTHTHSLHRTTGQVVAVASGERSLIAPRSLERLGGSSPHLKLL